MTFSTFSSDSSEDESSRSRRRRQPTLNRDRLSAYDRLMSGRGRGRGGPAGGGGGGRERGRDGVQSSSMAFQIGERRRNDRQSVHRSFVSSVSSSSLPGEFRNVSIGSAQSSSSEPGGARVTDTVQQTVMQQRPVVQTPSEQALSTQAPPHPLAVAPVPSSSKKLCMPERPSYGTAGKKLVIKANHFLVDLGHKDPYQYDVAISPEVTSKKRCKEIMKILSSSYKSSHLGNLMVAYDGKKSVFVAGPLPFESKEFVITVTGQNGREREFKVNIKFAARKDLRHLRDFLRGEKRGSPQETIQALDVVLRETASKNREEVGRSLFSPEFGKGVLGDGIEYWKGFYQSLRPTQMGVSLNINMSARAFFEPMLVSDFAQEFLHKDISTQLTDQDRHKLKRALRGVKVEVHRGYTKRYTVRDLTRQPMNQLTFTDPTGATLSVIQYFRERYNTNLRFPLLPAIQAGTEEKPTYLPLEICWLVEGQRYTPNLSEKQVTNLLRATCQRPYEREDSIGNTVWSNRYNDDPLVKYDFGLHVSEHFTSIEARVLRPPQVEYHGSLVVNPAVGQWNMIDKKLYNGGTVRHWAVANFSRQRVVSVERFCYELVKMCRQIGMHVNSESVIPMVTAQADNVERVLCNLKAQCDDQLERQAPGTRLDMLFVILPDADKGTYGRIKRVCETELGIVSQCCRPQHVSKLSKQYFESVAMKINVKVGGRNSILAKGLPNVADRPTIIFGADVTHPSKGEDSTPSIAAVVASMDWPHVTTYKALVSAQSHNQEIIQDLYTTTTDSKKGVVHGGLIRELLLSFKIATGQKPHRIIFYRDGEGEGQFNDVLLNEMDMIRKACVSLEEDYLPPVTFIIVQKRHHTRFFPSKHGDRNTTDRSGNILPGTVVDTKICHPTEFDFYLCSHAGIQGTSRPAHYHVLYDENKFNADELQTLTNSLCYTYARCTNSVSIVPPVYYAHLAAYRARSYLEGGDQSETSSRGGGQRATRDQVADHVRPLPEIHESVKSVMFYC